ncbi:MAG: hypothetical protein ACXAEU_24450 [Candidatus Hodarchaeales archaeon]|jgi:hypothetical protein
MIFFDLEFYVPPRDRAKRPPSLKANPYLPEHCLLGGVFAESIPFSSSIDDYDVKKLWLWREDFSEKQMLEKIFNYLTTAWKRADKEIIPLKTKEKDLVMSGINIASVDLPYLFARMEKHQIACPDQLFGMFFSAKIIDLSQIGTMIFKDFNGEMLYPPTTNGLKKHLRLKSPVKLSGTIVWKQYDNKDYQGIEDRTLQEIKDFISIYSKLLEIRKK